MPAIETLHDLMLHELKDIFGAERQLVKALPKLGSRVSSEELESALMDHLTETTQHVLRIEDCFRYLGETARARKCKAMEGLIAEGADLLDEEIDSEVLDSGIIAAAQRCEHYEMAAYGTLREYARLMGHAEVQALLEATLSEERQADQKLTVLAESGVSSLAMRDGQQDMGAKDGERVVSRSVSSEERARTGQGRPTSGAARPAMSPRDR
jgi:ferritin-like metal-binding protein YciE